jgi:hypothetical protein
MTKMAWYPAFEINRITISSYHDVLARESIIGWIVIDLKTNKWYWEAENHLSSDANGGPGQFDSAVLALESFYQFHAKKTKEYEDWKASMRGEKPVNDAKCQHENVGFCPLCF